MASKSSKGDESEVAFLLKHILAIELYRAGLSQAQIRKRLGLSMNLVNEMLKGLKRHVSTRTDGPE